MEASMVSHIAICVRDVEESLKFYRDILGMTVDFDQVQDTTSGGLPSIYKHSRKTGARRMCGTGRERPRRRWC